MIEGNIELLASHAPLWSRIQPLILKDRLPQAFLFVGPRHAGMLSFANRLIALLLCQHDHPPCGECRACHLLLNNSHPDVSYVRPDSAGGPIKIEQVRDLQQNIFQTPQLGSRRLIVMEAADRMNIGASNALLKVLEEPPAHTLFILIAEQMDSMPATILSRCQKYAFPSSDVSTNASRVDYFMLGQFYSEDAARGELMKQCAVIIASLCELREGKSSPCTLASQWSSYDFNDLLWILYLITAQAILDQLVDSDVVPTEDRGLARFSRLMNVVDLFYSLEQINATQRKINHNININQTLALEDLLLGYTRDFSKC